MDSEVLTANSGSVRTLFYVIAFRNILIFCLCAIRNDTIGLYRYNMQLKMMEAA